MRCPLLWQYVQKGICFPLVYFDWLVYASSKYLELRPYCTLLDIHRWILTRVGNHFSMLESTVVTTSSSPMGHTRVISSSIL
eukprot:c36603_g1_i1 orf=2-244(-)